uniref:Uncharacterized protein n=1 Tax=Octopus bimaculoides TaxID=37653 RepID=A0A0L8HYN5_OCTBM
MPPASIVKALYLCQKISTITRTNNRLNRQYRFPLRILIVLVMFNIKHYKMQTPLQTKLPNYLRSSYNFISQLARSHHLYNGFSLTLRTKFPSIMEVCSNV